ncbi:MAG: DNA-binding protein [Thermoplasmata archaeon]|nr:DNA-binding protein [Thermoplasmata archaeon]
MSTTGKSSGSSSVGREAPGPRTRVLLDANALFLPFVAGTDLEGEIRRLIEQAEIRVPSSVLRELRRLVARGEAHAREALELAGRFAVTPNQGVGDAALVALARAGDAVVTADRELQGRLRARGVEVLTPRDRVHLHRQRRARSGRPPRAYARGNY